MNTIGTGPRSSVARRGARKGVAGTHQELGDLISDKGVDTYVEARPVAERLAAACPPAPGRIVHLG
jgi:hypothetical protein